MRGLLLGAFSLVLICGLLCTCPAVVLAEPEAGVSRASNSPIDDCQKRFTEALRFIERENEYASEKARYRQIALERYSGQKWYDLGFPECVLLVPIFGIILPFFGLTIIGTVRSLRRPASARPTG